MTVRCLPVVLACLCAAAVAAHYQQPTFVTRAVGVRLDVSVLDGPAAVSGLEAQDFEVSDNGKPQRVSLVETRDAPLDLVLVVQPLRSMTKARQGFIQHAIETFHTLLRDDDRLAVMIGSAGPDVVRPLLPVTRDLAIAPLLTEAEGVTVRDAVLRAFLLFDAADRRKAIIVFTDGQHDQSFVTATGIEAAVLRQPAQVLLAALDSTRYGAIGTSVIGPTGRMSTELTSVTGDSQLRVPLYLANLTKRTGGRTIDLREGNAADRLSETLTYLRAQYVITYTPNNVPASGWHDVSVRLKGRKGIVITRAGYWAGNAK